MWRNYGASADSFYQVRPECADDVPETKFRIKVGKTLSSRRWHAAFTPEGYLDIGKILGRVCRGGIHPSIRGEVWEFLLGCYDSKSTFEEREQLRQRRRVQYAALKEECRGMFPLIGSGRFISAPVITEDGDPILDPIVLQELNAAKEPTSAGQVGPSDGFELVKEHDKKVIQWKLSLHQIGLDSLVLPKQKKKPYPIPLKKIQQAAKADKKLAEFGIEKKLEPPKNGLLVPSLVPAAYELLDDWKLLIKGLALLLHYVPVHACSECSQIHVAQSGHEIQDCLGPTNSSRRSFHCWVKGSINDVLIPIESYHMYDPFGARIKHETRFNYDRIPAVVELCIQAGVDLPGYPSRRRTKPIRMMGKKVIDIGGLVEEPRPTIDTNSAIMDLDTHRSFERFAPPLESEVPRIAQETIDAYERVKQGVTILMKKYTVKACGYCSEVHVGPWGHNAKLCGEFKHQWRDGKHGWQDATVDEVLPLNYVWHVQDPKGTPLRSALKRFYGKAPAVVEVCMQAGAQIPQKYKPMMRLDIVLPESEESRLVA